MTRRGFGTTLGTGLVASLAAAQVGSEKVLIASTQDITSKEISADLITPAKGFNWFGYSAPYLLALAGAGFLAMFIRNMRKPAAPVPASSGIASADAAALSKYEAEAAKDIADLED